MPVPVLTPSEAERLRRSKLLAIEKAIAHRDYLVETTSKGGQGMVAAHRDWFRQESVSPNAVIQVMVRLGECRAALEVLLDPDMAALAEANYQGFGPNWQADLIAVLAEIDKAIAACARRVPVSADGTVAIAVMDGVKGSLSYPAFRPETLAAVADALDAVVKAS